MEKQVEIISCKSFAQHLKKKKEKQVEIISCKSFARQLKKKKTAKAAILMVAQSR
jgi:hypothetical protein